MKFCHILHPSFLTLRRLLLLGFLAFCTCPADDKETGRRPSVQEWRIGKPPSFTRVVSPLILLHRPEQMWEVGYDEHGAALPVPVPKNRDKRKDLEMLEKVYSGLGFTMPSDADENLSSIKVWRDPENQEKNQVLFTSDLIAGINAYGVYSISNSPGRLATSFVKEERGYLLHCGPAASGGYVARLKMEGNQWVEKEIVQLTQVAFACCLDEDGDILVLTTTGIWRVSLGEAPKLIYGSVGFPPELDEYSNSRESWRWTIPTSMVVVDQPDETWKEFYKGLTGEEHGVAPINIMVGTTFGFILIHEIPYVMSAFTPQSARGNFSEWWCLPNDKLMQKMEDKGALFYLLAADQKRQLGLAESFVGKNEPVASANPLESAGLFHSWLETGTEDNRIEAP